MYNKPIIEIENINLEDIIAASGDEAMADPIAGDGIGNAVAD